MERQIDMRKLARNALIVLIMTGLIAYVIYHCLQYFKEPVQTTVAVRQTETQTQELTAYLFRDEQVLTSSRSGALQSLTGDGTHVSVDSEVARVYISGDGEALYAQLQSLNEQIAFCEMCLSAAELSPMQLPALNDEISQTYGELMNATTSGDGALAKKLSDELLLLLNQRQVLTGELSDLPMKLASLKAQRGAIETAYAGTYESITVDRSGYYFRETDGYEGLFSNEALKTMTLDGFDALISSPPAATDTDAGKLIGDYVWYAVLPTTLNDCQTLTEGFVYPITFANGTRVDMTLDRILTEPGEERCLLIMKTGHMPQGFAYTRVQSVSMEIGETRGLRVPQTALLVGKDGEMGVFILDVAYVRYRKIDIIWRGDGYVLVRESDRTQEGHENDLGYQELLITRSDEELYDGKLLY